MAQEDNALNKAHDNVPVRSHGKKGEANSMRGSLPALLIALTVATAGLVGCTQPKRPDLERLYASSRDTTDQPPVIVVPGLFGSRLRDVNSGEERWPGALGRILFSEYRDLALPFDSGTLEPEPGSLEPHGIAEKAVGRDFYGRILDTLENAGGYVRGRPGEAPRNEGRQYYVLTYDWRRGLVNSARALDDLVEQIRADYGNDDLGVDVVAHSMGGLVARYYARYGRRDVLDDNEFPVNNHGAERLRRAILLGTPNLGSLRSVIALIEGERIGFNRVPPEVIATMPSVLQLLPHPINRWIVTPDGRELERDLFEARIWRRFEWGIYKPEIKRRIIDQYDNPEAGQRYWRALDRYFEKHLERARRFVWSLTVPLPEVSLRYVVFGGDCHLTPARIVVEEIQGESRVRLWPDEVRNPLKGIDYDRLMLEPGDGSVTKSSLLARDTLDPTVPRHPYSFFPLDYPFFLCEPHNSLTGNVHFRDNLLHALLTRDR